MSQAQQFPHQGSSARAGALEFAATLLPAWGFRRDTDIALADARGVNNQTFLVRHRRQRYVLRVTGFLSFAEVRAEHRILRRLRQGDLPFRVPEPVAAPNGQTVIETPAGPATLCRWLPGVRPGVGSEMAPPRPGHPR
jgi:homoserine kinase type II